MKLNLQGIEVKAARVLVGMRGHRPSAKNVCIGKKMHEKAGQFKGKGGRHSKEVHQAFVQAAKDCGFNIRKAISDVR
jgi:hypothetical protein